MRMKLIFCLLIFIFIGSNILFSQSQLEMNTQAARDFYKADSSLNIIYKQLLSKISEPDQKQLIVKAQRAWILFKEAHCKALAAQYEGGSMKGMILGNCLAEMTKERIIHLKKFLQGN